MNARSARLISLNSNQLFLNLSLCPIYNYLGKTAGGPGKRGQQVCFDCFVIFPILTKVSIDASNKLTIISLFQSVLNQADDSTGCVCVELNQSHPSPDAFHNGIRLILAWSSVAQTTHTLAQAVNCLRCEGKSDTFQASQALHVVYPVWPNWDELSCFYWGPEVRWRRGSLCPGPRPPCLGPQWQRRSTVPHPLQEMRFIQDQPASSQQAANQQPLGA